MKKTTETTQTEQMPPQAEPIPNPPGGGRWKWDGKQWQSLDEQTEQPTETQE
ncbi:MAG TPA: hypothetical protein VGE12_18660 [Noviherbaspirillum sp.]